MKRKNNTAAAELATKSFIQKLKLNTTTTTNCYNNQQQQQRYNQNKKTAQLDCYEGNQSENKINNKNNNTN